MFGRPQTAFQGCSSPKGRRKKLGGIEGGLLGLIMAMLLVAETGPADAQGNKTYNLDLTKCAGFTVEDASKILSLPATKLTAKTEKIGPASWRCGFTAPDGRGVSFSVSIAKDAKKAAAEMEQLRDNLELAAGTAPFKNRLPQGAYSEISGPGLGDESVWTDVNGTLTVRKGNVTVQVLMPSGKKEQIRVAQAFLAKF